MVGLEKCKRRGRVILVLQNLEIKVETTFEKKPSGLIVSSYGIANIMLYGLCKEAIMIYFAYLFLCRLLLYTLCILSFSLFLVFIAPEWLHPFPLPACLWSQIYLQSPCLQKSRFISLIEKQDLSLEGRFEVLLCFPSIVISSLAS